MTLKSAHIDWINIALLLIAAAAAFALPFEVFLFSYAVLGPLHYLTEISWLHERKYFANGVRDAAVLLVFGILLFGLSIIMPSYFAPPQEASPAVKQSFALFLNRGGATIIYLAFMSALAMITFRTLSSKIVFMLVAVVFLMGLIRAQTWMLFFSVFLPTLIHVYVFTAAFMLLGALKSRSVPGLLSFVLLLGIGGFLLWYRPDVSTTVSTEVRQHYSLFVELNRWLARLFGEELANPEQAYQSALGVSLMRFIAFAYTYHYLNWFSKTTIIKWHQVNKIRLMVITLLWIVAVLLYWWNYKYGFVALYTLSFLHVFFEFPLNWRSFGDLGREVRGVVQNGWDRPAIAKPAA